MTGPVGGRLIGLIAADLPGHRLTREKDGTAIFVPDGGGPTLEVGVRVEKRFLGRTEVARFRTVIPARSSGKGRLSVTQTGRFRRQGIALQVAEGTESTARFAGTLRVDPEFAESATRLDFTRFDIDLDGENCIATIELMGGSLVSIAFPPIRSYVRLHEDQREALMASLVALERITGD